jgi:hypothetical protein
MFILYSKSTIKYTFSHIELRKKNFNNWQKQRKENKIDMNIIFRLAYIILGTILLPISNIKAQVQAGMKVALIAPQTSNSMTIPRLGGTVFGRYSVGTHFAVGINIKYLVDNPFDNSIEVGKLSIVNSQVEYFFLQHAKLRPYIGLESGIYKTSFRKNSQYDKVKPVINFGIAPKIGLQYTLSKSFDLSLDTGYHLILQEGFKDRGLIIETGLVYIFKRSIR